jgi:acetate kinase
MSGIILTCNAGSVNTRLAAFDAQTLERTAHTTTHNAAEFAEWLCSAGAGGVVVVGHRVVHGGQEFTQPVVITDAVFTALRELIPLAPLHQPAALKMIEQARKLYPNVPHIACFDTAFHHTIPKLERHFPLPAEYFEEGIMRYGFHGLSYQHVADALKDFPKKIAKGRVIVAHLGGGSSACAMKNLQSVDSTMGFSTLDGLMMGTRCGALDPGVLLYLLNEKHMSVPELSNLLYHDSGLKGVSGISTDMRELLQSTSPAAHEAVELYCHLAAKEIAALLPALGGLDALVFTGGIGENAAPIRDRIIKLLRWVGEFEVYVITTDEEIVIAKSCQQIIG